MSKWQPIETAPKDGRLVMVYVPTETNADGAYRPLITRADDLMHRKHYHWMEHATHWMPLPEPPK